MYGDEEEVLAAKSEDPVMRKIWEDKVGTVDINVKKVFFGTHAIINWVSKLQGDPNQNLLFQLALCLNVGIPDPKLVKPKCV